MCVCVCGVVSSFFQVLSLVHSWFLAGQFRSLVTMAEQIVAPLEICWSYEGRLTSCTLLPA